MASAFFRGHGKGCIHTSFLLQPIELSKERNFFNLKNLKASEQKSWLHQTRLLCFDEKEIWIQIPPGNKLVARDALLHTRDACCTLCCGRTAKPLFHEVETVDLWVWFPSMICLGWWAGTTGPPRISPNQGCEHLSVMPLFRKCYVPKKSQKYFEEWGKSL